MTYSPDEIEDVFLPLPITRTARRLAQQFANQQVNPQKAEQVYLNTVAVSVVNDYLRLMGISTDLAASDSWNPVIRLCTDIADLEVTGVGRLECCPVRSDEQTCQIPPEVWQDRIGYVVVHIDQSFREATLLGFVQTAVTEGLPLSQLQPLEGLLAHLNQLRQPVTAPEATSGRALVNLSQWLENLSATGWQTVEALLGTTETNLAFSFRSTDSARVADPNPGTGVRLAKLIDLGVQLVSHSVALIVELRPGDNQQTDICLKVNPTGSQLYLPPSLELIVLDASGAIFLEAQARNTDNYIQLHFSGEPGEQFSVKVALGSDSITEDFVI